ncbi:MAG: chromate transporter [Oscillospiraceae bacterium]
MNEEKGKPFKLFLTFLKIGAFTFGGGYAMIPLIQKETVEKHHWIKDEDILDVVAIAESTPGPIAINSATFVGYHVAGVAGAFCATLGVVLPSFAIILGISYILRQFESLEVVKFAFNGIRVGVLALIIKALVYMYKQCPKNIMAYVIAAGAFVAVAIFKVSALIVIVASALLGLASALLARKAAKL